MTSQTRVTEPGPTAPPWAALTWFTALLLLCYAPILGPLAHQWQADEDMAHGPFALLVAGYIVWLKRSALFSQPAAPDRLGLALCGLAAVQYVVASLGAELFLMRTALVLSIAGAVLLLRGRPTLRILIFPLFLLLFTIPIPGLLYKQITFPLQLIASSVSETSLELLGYSVLRDGNILELAGQQLSVVEACSGIRSLFSLSFLVLTYAYFMESRLWVRLALFLATPPVAVLANAGRIVLTAVVGEHNEAWAHGVYHAVSGWVVSLAGFGLIVLLHGLIRRAIRLRRPA